MTRNLLGKLLKTKYKKNIRYNQNQLARTVVLEVFNAVVLKY